MTRHAASIPTKDHFLPFKNEAGSILCGARRRQCSCGYRYSKDQRELKECPECGKDRRCHRRVRTLTDRCIFHLGRARAAYALKTKHSRHSKYFAGLPDDLRERAESVLRDDSWLSNRHAIALLQARFMELCDRLKSGENRFWLKQLHECWNGLIEANKAVGAAREEGDADKVLAAQVQAQAAMTRLGETIRRAKDIEKVWDDIFNVTGKVSGLQRNEAEIIERYRGTMTAAEAYMYALRLRDAVFDVIDDQHQRKAIFERFEILVGRHRKVSDGVDVIKPGSGGQTRIEHAEIVAEGEGESKVADAHQFESGTPPAV